MFLKRRPAAGVALVAAAALTLTACGGDDDDGGDGTADVGGLEACEEAPNECNSGERAEGGQLTWALNSPWESWNSNTSEGNSVYLTQAIYGILPPDTAAPNFLPDGTYEWSADVLTEAPALVSEDPMVVRYVMNPNAVWTLPDGSTAPMGTVEDFQFNWYSLTTPGDYCSADCDPASTSGDDIVSIDEVDGGIEVTFRDGYTDPEWSYGVPISLPAQVATDEGFDWQNDPAEMGAAAQWFNDTVPAWSGGPYMLDPEATTVGEQSSLVPNPNWWGEIKPTLERLNLVVVEDQATILDQLRNQEINGSEPSSLDPDVVEQAGSTPGVLSALGPRPAWDHFDFNLSNELLSDPEVRRAIMTAIDQQAIIDATYAPLMGGGTIEPRKNSIFDNNSEYYEDHYTDLNIGLGDVEGAKQILTDAGYDISSGEITKDGETFDPLRVVILEGNKMREISLNLIATMLNEELGISAETETTSDLGGTLSNQDFDIIEFGWIGSPLFTGTPDQYWNSGSGSNFVGIDNPDLDALTDQVLETTDISQSAATANEADKLAIQEYAIMAQVSTPGLIMMSENVTNIRPNGNTQIGSLYNLAEWGLKA